MENDSLVYGTHILGVKRGEQLIIPAFYKNALLNKKIIIEKYFDFAPIFDLTLKRTYQVFYSGIEKELLGLPEEVDVSDNFIINSLIFDESLLVTDILMALPQEKKSWFVNELYQNLFLEKGLYPTKNYDDKLDNMHPYILFIPTKFTQSLDFHYSSIDELVKEFYNNKEKRRQKQIEKYGNKVVKKGDNFGLEYIAFKAAKMPKTRHCLFVSMYCGHLIGQIPLKIYYKKIKQNCRALTRRINKMFERRLIKYGYIANK